MTAASSDHHQLLSAVRNLPLQRYSPEVLLIRIAVMQVVFYTAQQLELLNNPVDKLLATSWVRADREFYPDIALHITDAGRRQAFSTLMPADVKEAEKLADQWRLVEAERLLEYRRLHTRKEPA